VEISGNCPTVTFTLSGKTACGLIDTGSEVSTVTEGWVLQNIQQPELLPVSHLTLRAANGLEIPYSGLLVARITIFGQQLEDVPVLVVKDPIDPVTLARNRQVPALLGINILSALAGSSIPTSSIPAYLQPLLQEARLEKRSLHGLARTVTPTVVQPHTIVTIKITGATHHSKNFLASPLVQTLPGRLLLIPTLVDKNGREQYVRFANVTDEPVSLPAKTPIATLHAVEGIERAQSAKVECVCSCNSVVVSVEDSPAVSTDTIQCPDFEGTEEQKAKLSAVLNTYAHAFQKDENDTGYTDRLLHKIPTVDDVPVTRPHRPIPPQQLKEVQDHLNSLLEQIIKESHSPYAAPVVLVRKKDVSLRLCVDYRGLNSKTVGDAFPLPCIQESLDALVGAKYFSSLDLASGYY
jgi:hypothetical protein